HERRSPRREDRMSTREMTGCAFGPAPDLVRTAVAALALVLGLAAPASAQAPSRGGTLVVAFQRDVLNIDPHMWTANATRKVMVNVYEGLTGRDAKLAVTPQLAESWTIS